MKKKKKQAHYIDNKRFEELIELYREGDLSCEEELMSMFDLLIKNVLEAFGFQVDFEDAKQDCFVLILRTLKNFHPDKGKAFNFFTTIIVNNLKLVYTKSKKYKNKINTYVELKTGTHPSSLNL